VQYLEASIPNISRIDIDGRIASKFSLWFQTYVSIVQCYHTNIRNSDIVMYGY